MQIIMREDVLFCDGNAFFSLRAKSIYEMPRRDAIALLKKRRAHLFPSPLMNWSVDMTSPFMPRRLVRSTAPATEPVSLSEAKLFLRIDGTDEDTLVMDMIAAARIAAEEQTGKSLITQSWQLHYDSYTPPMVALPNAPVQSITAVTVMDETGGETIIASAQYYLNALQELVFKTIPAGHIIRIEYVAGFGDAASDVPTDLAQAILLHVAHLYEHRDSMTPPLASQLHYAKHREVRL